MKTIESPVRIALIGSGNIAAVHVAALNLLPEAKLVGVCARTEEKARAVAGDDAVPVYTSVDDLLRETTAEAVLIATPSGAHHESAMPALRSGKHVLCEKPLEINSRRVAEMIEEAERQQRILAGFFPLRCGVGAQAIRQALEQGRFGRVTFLSARVKWWREASYYQGSNWRGTWALDGGGALMNQGIHAVDLLQWIGGPVSEVSGFTGTLAHQGIEVEDTLAATVKFTGGGLGTIEATTSCYPGLDLSLEVSGDAGTAVLVNDRIDLWKFRDERAEDDAIRAGQAAGAVGGGASDPKAITCEGHRRQIEGFCRAIRGEAGADIIDGREAGRAVAIVEAIYRSARSGQAEKISTL